MADPTLANLQLFYTGGGANNTPSLSIGGAISSERVLSQTASALTTLTGVTIDDAVGNTEGNGTLTYTASSTSLTYQPPNGSPGTAINVSAGGTFFIQGASNAGGLAVTVVAASLPTATVANTVAIANRLNKFFADQTKAESDAGVTKYHCFGIKNTHATLPMVDVSMWIASNTPGADTDSLFLDPLAASDGTVGPTAVANENTAPAASAFVVPDSLTHADVLDFGTLTAGQVRFFWVKQLTPAGVTEATPANTFVPTLYMRS